MKQGLTWSWCKCVEQHSTEAAGRGESVSAVTLMAAEDGWTMNHVPAAVVAALLFVFICSGNHFLNHFS